MPTHRPRSRPTWMTLVAGAAVSIGFGALPACNNTTGGGGISGQTLDRSGSPGAQDDVAAQIQSDVEAARALLAAQEQTASPPPPAYETPRPRPAPIVAEAGPTEANIGASVSIDDDGGAADGALAAAPAPEPAATIDERIARAGADLAHALRERAGEDASPFGALAALGTLEVISPGLGAPPSDAALSGAEDQALGAWRAALSQASSELRSGAGPEALERVARTLLENLRSGRSIDIPRFALCTRVDGFGQFDEFASTAFLAQRRHRAIVYVEVDRFTAAPAADAAGATGYQVALTQGVSLYHSDGTLAWRQTDQDTTDFSRNQRRDFFVVQKIELPETLTVGSYNLKVTMRDKATGAVAERTMPITVVADPSLTRPAGSPTRR